MSQVRTNVGEKRQPKTPQPAMKGCCCKRSQCIKNYCDCYQSMVICSKHCKCIGCRNTEVRNALNAGPSKSASKRERAAALTAKTAAAAAKAALDMQAKVSMQNTSGVAAAPPFVYGLQMPFSYLPAQQTPLNVPIQMQMPMQHFPQMAQLPVPMTQQPVPITQVPVQMTREAPLGGGQSIQPMQPLAVKPIKQQVVVPQPSPPPSPPPPDDKDKNIFTPSINAALLDCLLLQAEEGEEVGLDEEEVGMLILNELARGIFCLLDSTNSPDT